MDFGLVVGFTALPFFVFDCMQGNASMSGYIAAVQSLCYGMACLATAPFVARAKNGLRWAVAGSAGYAILFSSACFFPTPLPFMLLSVTGLTCLSLYWPALQSWLGAEPDPELRRKQMAHFNIAWTAGLCLGPLAVGYLYAIHPRVPFAATFVCAGLSMLLVATLPREKRPLPAEAEIPTNDGPSHRRTGEAHLYCTWLVNMVTWALVGASRSVFPKRIAELVDGNQLVLLADALPLHTFDNAPKAYSYLAASVALSRAAAFWTMGKTHRWHGNFGILLVLQIAAAAAFWLMGVTNSLALMMLSFLTFGLTGGAAYFASLYYSTINPVLKHRRAAIHEASVGIGSATGSLGFGLLAWLCGVTWPFRFTPLFVLVCILLQIILLAWGKRKYA
jgi:MFS family permease